MNATAGLPLPRLSCGRFTYELEGAIEAYTDEALFEACGVRIAFTLRTGGVSAGPFVSLNLGYGQGDLDENVDANRAILARAFGITHQFLSPKQVHGTSVVSLDSTDAHTFEAAQREAQAGCDSVLIGHRDVAALLCFADCLPLILVAPTGDFAVVHCGWRGTVAHLARISLERLLAQAGCDASQINAYIGPYIHVECFEVSSETAQQFDDEFGAGVCTVLAQEGSAQHFVNLGAAVAHDLVGCGMVPERIVESELCTLCHPDQLFSYRYSGGQCGRQGALAFSYGKE